MKIKTVNVVWVGGDEIDALYSYPDTPEGNKAAERKFLKFVSTFRNLSKEDKEILLVDRFATEGNFAVYLTHSN